MITPSGRGLLAVAGGVETWYSGHPDGTLEYTVGWRAFEDAGEGWRSGLLEWIVRLAPADGDTRRGLPGCGERPLRERLAAMGEAKMVERRRGPDGLSRLWLTPWAARVMRPLTGLARWEQSFRPPGWAAMEIEDVVVAILAILPLIQTWPEATGVCTLTVESGASALGGRRTRTVWISLAGGRAIEGGEGVPPRFADGWTTGTLDAWLSALLDGRLGALRSSGRDSTSEKVPVAVVSELHAALNGEMPQRSVCERSSP
jgi:DNA-binding HxlR family transcriptional regulator